MNIKSSNEMLFRRLFLKLTTVQFNLNTVHRHADQSEDSDPGILGRVWPAQCAHGLPHSKDSICS